MDFSEWEPTYLRIAADFGYSVEADRRGAEALARIAGSGTDAAVARASGLLSGRRVAVAGGALGRLPPELARGPGAGPAPLIATGASVPVLLAGGVVPDVVVTDLDKEADAQLEACRRGALAVIHAHGDNVPLLETLAPRFPPPVLCTCQCRPVPGCANFGGFTDGDRAVLMARALGASGADLHGFDWGAASGAKARKLSWARRIVESQGTFARVVA